MATILEAQKRIEEFFFKGLKKKGTVKDVSKTDEGWRGLFEAIEENELLKRKGFHDVFERTLYRIELDQALEATSYGLYAGEVEGEEK